MTELLSSQSKYESKFSISQSSLKDWKTMSPSKWKAMWVDKTIPRPKKAATTLGSFLDCLIFTPKDIDKRFIISQVALPSDKVRLILDAAFQRVEELNKNAQVFNLENPKAIQIPMKEHTLEDKDYICSLCLEFDHYKNKLDQAYNDVLKKGGAYFEFLTTTKGRQVISPEDNIKAVNLKEILLSNKISKGFFVPKKDCEVVFQVRIFSEFELDGFDNLDFLPTKGALDIVHFNHTRKEVREVDLKYTDDAFLFDGPLGPVKRFDYPGQHSFYDYLLREWLNTYKGGKYKDYAVMNPLNVVIDDGEKVPYIYAYKLEDLNIKRFGLEGSSVRGWEDSIKEIAWHFNSGDWSRPREHQQNGFISIKTFGRK